VKVFISWSGTRSRETAKLLRRWLKQVINEVEPWMSDEDLTKGGDWSGDITNQLNAAEFGIISDVPHFSGSIWAPTCGGQCFADRGGWGGAL
jgi:hypothetical protein